MSAVIQWGCSKNLSEGHLLWLGIWYGKGMKSTSLQDFMSLRPRIAGRTAKERRPFSDLEIPTRTLQVAIGPATSLDSS